MISQRPAEVEDRAVPGHWEGDDRLMGQGQTAIGTLVKRHTRYMMPFAPRRELRRGPASGALCDRATLPEHLSEFLEWDQGKEIAQHVQFSVDIGVEVFFYDPNSPRQRGTNENTNGLLRQYFPKGTDMCGPTQQDLDQAAYSLNTHARQTLDWMTPSDNSPKRCNNHLKLHPIWAG